jgi:hypothetical protein
MLFLEKSPGLTLAPGQAAYGTGKPPWSTVGIPMNHPNIAG